MGGFLIEDCGKASDKIIGVLKEEDDDMWSKVKDVNELPVQLIV